MIKKIAIIGSAGAGKSTLAIKLHLITNLPIYHLDNYFWKPGWVESQFEEYKRVHDKICDLDKWIIDGMNLKHFLYRIEKADVIIFLDYSRLKCIRNVLKRTIINYGKTIQSQGCPEKINFRYFKFLKWIWNFQKIYKPIISELIDQKKNEKEIYIIKSNEDLNQLIVDFKGKFEVKD